MCQRRTVFTPITVEYGSPMRMFPKAPKALSRFHEIVNERGKQLRLLPFAQLARLSEPTEHLTVDLRPAKISVIVQPQLTSEGVRVVVQGFMKTRLIGWHVALHGFYKYPDEAIAEMADEEFKDFD
jgi:hypothetical protein